MAESNYREDQLATGRTLGLIHGGDEQDAPGLYARCQQRLVPLGRMPSGVDIDVPRNLTQHRRDTGSAMELGDTDDSMFHSILLSIHACNEYCTRKPPVKVAPTTLATL